MKMKDESQLNQSIKSGYLYRVYLLYGPESYLRQLYRGKLIRLAVGDSFSEFNLHCFDGNALDTDRLIEACESMPFLAEQRCVVVDAFDYEGLSASDRSKVDALLADPVESTVLVLLVDKEDFNPKKSSKAKKLIELCDKAGAVLELGHRSATDVARFLRARAESQGCTLSRELCDYLTQRCQSDLLTLSNEMEKLTAWVRSQAPEGAEGPLEITRQDIDQVTCRTVEASVYNLAKAILGDRFEAAMELVQDLLYLRLEPTAILAALSGAYLDLYIAKAAKNAGKGEGEIKQNFSYQRREFVIRNSLRDCSRYSTQVLRRSIQRLAQADLQLKSSRADDRVILEQTVTELYLIANSQG